MLLKNVKHFFFTNVAKWLIKGNKEETQLVKVHKPMSEWRVAFLTTAGVHLKTQDAFNVKEGDHTFREIPDNCSSEELMVTHTHYDTTDAEKDINCVFPIAILHELRNEHMIGSTSSIHYGMMGYIPNTKPLLTETIPELIAKLKKDNVDILLLSPG